MMVRNPRTGALLAGRTERAGTFSARLRGLLGRRSLGDGEGLLIDPCASVHTWFMRFPIDVVFLGPDLRVLSMFPHLEPWRIRSNRRAAMVLELRAGTLLRSGTRQGDALELEV